MRRTDPRRLRRFVPPTFPTLVPFAESLERLRLERQLTQRALAAQADISMKHYQQIASAHVNPTIRVLLRLAKALDVSLNDLFGL